MSSVTAGPVATRSEAEVLAATYGQRIVASLPMMFARGISLHDARGHVHWHNGEVLGPSEREGIRTALEGFTGQGAPARIDHSVQGERTAVLLRATNENFDFTGFAMLMVDNRRLRGKGRAAADLPVPVTRAVREWGEKVQLCAAFGAEPVAIDEQGADQLLDSGPTVADADIDRYFAQLREFPLALFAQRLTPMQSGIRIRRYEVLLRAADAEADASAPAALLRDADARGLGSVLDRRVLRELVLWLRTRSEIWNQEPAQFSMNLSNTSLRDQHFLKFAALCIEKSGLPHGLIAFEIDQAHALEHMQRTEHFAAAVERAGAGLVIDNFSLHERSADLLSLPGLRLVKVDRTLTLALAEVKAAQARIAGIAQMARVSGVHSVAKRIDDAAEETLLAALGVDFQQGFATATPAPLDDVDDERVMRLVVDPAVANDDDLADEVVPEFLIARNER
ncbi:MAG: EAL domain-containing protein [Steroidobacteraceae bacterium]